MILSSWTVTLKPNANLGNRCSSSVWAYCSLLVLIFNSTNSDDLIFLCISYPSLRLSQLACFIFPLYFIFYFLWKWRHAHPDLPDKALYLATPVVFCQCSHSLPPFTHGADYLLITYLPGLNLPKVLLPPPSLLLDLFCLLPSSDKGPTSWNVSWRTFMWV